MVELGLIGHSIGAQQSDIERTIIMAAKPSGNKSVWSCRDFGDFGACSSAVAVVVGPSMKLRSRDFGDEVMVKSRSVPVFPQ